jgi:hypothetical protein
MTNFERWSGLKESWDDRIVLMAERIRPGSSIIDLGAGQQALRKYLPADSRYQACDLVARDRDTIVCDFNKGQLPPLRKYDYVFCSGLLEYIVDLTEFISRLTAYSDRFLVSYAVKINSQTIEQRRKLDWVNDHTLAEIMGILQDAGLFIKDIGLVYEQRMFSLEKRAMDPAAKAKNRRDALWADRVNVFKRTFHLKQAWASLTNTED